MLVAGYSSGNVYLDHLSDNVSHLITSAASSAGTADASSTITAAHSVTSDGRYAIFTSVAANLVTGATGLNLGITQLYLSDRQTGRTYLISQYSGAAANSSIQSAAIAADGPIVTFTTYANNLSPAGTDPFPTYYGYSRSTAPT